MDRQSVPARSRPVDLHHVGVVEFGGGACLANELLDAPFGPFARLAAAFGAGGDDLQSHLPLQLHVLGAKDLPHRALAHDRRQPEPAYALAKPGRCGCG